MGREGEGGVEVLADGFGEQDVHVVSARERLHAGGHVVTAGRCTCTPCARGCRPARPARLKEITDELGTIERELGHYAAAVAQGGPLDVLVSEINSWEQQKARLLAERDRLPDPRAVASLDRARSKDEISRRVAQCRSFGADDVQKVVVRMASDEARTVNDREIPDICLQHMVAVMLLDKTVSFAAAHDKARMKDPVVLRQRAKVELLADPRIDAVRPRREGIVELTLADGTQMSEWIRRRAGR